MSRDDRCVVCGNTESSHAFIGRDWQLAAVPGSFSYVRCTSCATVRAKPAPNDAELARAYPRSYHARGFQQEVLRRAGDVFGRREARRLAELGGFRGRVLDVGCGEGSFLVRLRSAGWQGQLCGLEPEAGAAARARARGIGVEEGTIERFDTSETFDLVVLRHVIEHVRDPLVVLDRIHGVLRPGGTLYLATPDEHALCARVFGRFWHGYDPPRHLWVFRPSGVHRLLAHSGFDVVEDRWDFAPVMWAASFAYLLSPEPSRRRVLASMFNPLVMPPTFLAAGIEVMLRRSTMYAATARRR